MTPRFIIDAGPALNFLATNHERLLLGMLRPLSAPETVRDEVLDKSRKDPRLGPAERIWKRLSEKYLTILSDDTTPELAAVVQRVSHLPMAERMTHRKDRGELMVLAHAVVTAETGLDVTILIDDGSGARDATKEARRLTRLRARGQPFGSLTLINTIIVLERAAGGKYLPDREEMRKTYARMRKCDDGLVAIEQTNLLSADIWG